MKGTRPQRLFSDWSLERTACSALEKEHPQEVCVCVCGVTLCPDVSVCHEQLQFRREKKMWPLK